MKISEAKKSVFKVRIELGEYNSDLAGEFIELAEPGYEDIAQLQTLSETEQVDWFGKILPGRVVDSSFTFESGKPADGKAVAEFVLCSADLTLSILEKWTEECPFFSRTKKNESSEIAPSSTLPEGTQDETGK